MVAKDNSILFNEYEYEEALKGISTQMIIQLAARNALRIFAIANTKKSEFNTFKYIIELLNAIFVSYYNERNNKITNLYSEGARFVFNSTYTKVTHAASKAYSYMAVPDSGSYVFQYVAQAAFSSASTSSNIANRIKFAVDTARATTSAANAASSAYSDKYKLLVNEMYYDLNLAKNNRLAVYTKLYNIFEGDEIFIKTEKILKKIDSRLSFYMPFIKNRISGEEIDNNEKLFFRSLLSVSKEKYSQGYESVFNFIRDQHSGKLSEEVNIARVIFIGPGGSGKTSIIKALNEEEIIEGKEKATPGITTSKWKWGLDCDIDIHFWDFAGQVITHSMHKFFLRERCLYIILLTTRDDQKLEAQAEYWLEHVRLYGNNSPSIVVANKIDTDNKIAVFDEKELREKYSSIIDFKKISVLKYNSDEEFNGISFRNYFNQFKSLFINSICSVVKKYKNELTQEQNKIKRIILSKNEDFITKTEFFKICNECNIIDQKNIEDLMSFFNNLGVIVHFPAIHQDALLNPKWLSYGVYQVLRESENEVMKGWISHDKIREQLSKGIFQDYGEKLMYSIDKINTLIIKSIIGFKLGYNARLKGTDILVLPSVLDKNPPNHGFSTTTDSLHFIFDFEIMAPPFIFHAFVSQYSEKIYNDFVWQSGVVLKSNSKKATVLIRNFDYRKIELFLYVDNEDCAKSGTEFLFDLINCINNIIASENENEFPDYKENIEIPIKYYLPETIEHGKSRICSFITVNKFRLEGKADLIFNDYGMFSIKKLFGDYPMDKKYKEVPSAKTTVNNESGTVIIGGSNNSYSIGYQNINIKENIINDLISNLNDLIVKTSNCENIKEDISDIKEFVNKLSRNQKRLNKKEIDKIKNKMKNKSFLEKISEYTSIANNCIPLFNKLYSFFG